MVSHLMWPDVCCKTCDLSAYSFCNIFVPDEYARVLPEEVSTTSLRKKCVPPLGDIDIRVVNRCLYPRPYKGESWYRTAEPCYTGDGVYGQRACYSQGYYFNGDSFGVHWYFVKPRTSTSRLPIGNFGILGSTIVESLTISLLDRPKPVLYYFTLSNARQFYLSRESLWVGKG